MTVPVATLFAEARFCHAWRPYQARVLETLDEHMDDDHLHVVAPPGSGKTVLGLEVIRRIGKPALVLVPTITIREQWLRRLEEDFLRPGIPLMGVSGNVTEPGLLTVTTYQGLYSQFKAVGAKALIAALQAHRVATLAVDEAHHLRAQWWRCLDEVKRGLGTVKVVALTGTPPYDAPNEEWNRYAAFCGTVDEEIGVPELVLDGNLCPHQDLVYLCQPTRDELARLQDYEMQLERLVRDLAIDTELATLLAEDSRLRAPAAHLDTILKASDFWLSIAVYLNGVKWEAARALLDIMGLKRVNLPDFDLDWAERMLNGLLFDGACDVPAIGEKLAELEHRLRRIGAIERRRAQLRQTKLNQRLLKSGRGLLQSVSRIVELEIRTQPHRLRLVILTDHIRASAFPSVHDQETAFVKLGVVPIFETLRRLRLPEIRPCILTGTLIVIPRDCEAALRTEGVTLGVDASRLRMPELWHAPDYLRVELTGGERKLGVALVTRLFREGLLNTIVGTASLLGEGWDAPSVNTLVLASTIASYVTSNQMRGRAIRAWRRDPNKVANIWHLTCVAPRSPGLAANGGRTIPPQSGDSDGFGKLKRRFRSFVGLVHDAPRQESGIERLGFETCALTASDIQAWNVRMARLADRREELASRWQAALGPADSNSLRLVREVRCNVGQLQPRFSRWLGRCDSGRHRLAGRVDDCRMA